MTPDFTHSDTLRSVLGHVGLPRVLVVGDCILHRYTWGNAERVSPEAPVTVLNVDREEARLGGAAGVGLLTTGLGAKVVVASVVGDDLPGHEIQKLMKEGSIDSSLVFTNSDRTTTVKQRFVGRAAARHPQQILRVDHEVCEFLDDELDFSRSTIPRWVFTAKRIGFSWPNRCRCPRSKVHRQHHSPVQRIRPRRNQSVESAGRRQDNSARTQPSHDRTITDLPGHAAKL